MLLSQLQRRKKVIFEKNSRVSLVNCFKKQETLLNRNGERKEKLNPQFFLFNTVAFPANDDDGYRTYLPSSEIISILAHYETFSPQH